MALFPRGVARAATPDAAAATAAGLQPNGWPSTCVVCRRWPGAAVCADCLARFGPQVPRCLGCALRLAADTPWCGDCAREAPPFERTIAAVDYAFPWDGLINDLKHRAQLDLAPVLAALMQRALVDARETAARRGQALAACDLVVPVPLSNGRLRERGHNQAWELARRLAQAEGLMARADGLQRVHEASAQQGLGRAERLANLRGAFVLGPAARAQVAGRRIALVDDVMTTGATLREAAAALLRGGATAVQAWVLARTPAA